MPSSFSLSEEDPCSNDGIVVRNITTIDLWYKQSNSGCLKWKQNKLFTIKPDEMITLYSDLDCKTSYCGREFGYDKYRSIDTDGNCRVKILTRCTLSDM